METGKRDVLLVASGDLRQSANRRCWPAQEALESALAEAVADAGYRLVRAHPVDERAGHGFIASQAMGMKVFTEIDPRARLIVAEAVWQYSHHVLSVIPSTLLTPNLTIKFKYSCLRVHETDL